MNYKDFDFYTQIQGLGGFLNHIEKHRMALYNQGPIEKWQWEESWTEENPDRYARYPKFVSSYQSPAFDNVSEYWLRDGLFVRVKNIVVGYTLPQVIVDNTFINSVRIYVSGRNLFTWSADHYYGWDPEMDVSNLNNS